MFPGKLLPLLFLIAVMYSCKTETSHLPPGKMQAVLTDLHYAEVLSMAVNKDSALRRSQRDLDSLALFYKSVFSHHGISRQEFHTSLEWYKHNPDELDSIYNRMVPYFTAQEIIYNN
ncbi:MAG: DUF4296 domain-containing protein [Sphingobacteriales bacterium]|nr:MAG: DUF4296 domain-containing protein [Sphingobacteriales bacterium]